MARKNNELAFHHSRFRTPAELSRETQQRPTSHSFARSPVHFNGNNLSDRAIGHLTALFIHRQMFTLSPHLLPTSRRQIRSPNRKHKRYFPLDSHLRRPRLFSCRARKPHRRLFIQCRFVTVYIDSYKENKPLVPRCVSEHAIDKKPLHQQNRLTKPF